MTDITKLFLNVSENSSIPYSPEHLIKDKFSAKNIKRASDCHVDLPAAKPPEQVYILITVHSARIRDDLPARAAAPLPELSDKPLLNPWHFPSTSTAWIRNSSQ